MSGAREVKYGLSSGLAHTVSSRFSFQLELQPAGGAAHGLQD